MDREIVGGISVWKGLEKIEIDRDSVFNKMKIGFPGDSSYEEMSKDFYAVRDACVRKMNPMVAAVISKGSQSFVGRNSSEKLPVLYTMLTLGSLVSEESDAYFARGEYVKGLLCDAISDHSIFAYEESMQSEICSLCRESGYGVSGRIVPTDSDLPHFNRATFEALDAWNTLGVQMSRSFMFNPIKTIATVYRLSEDINEMRLEHDCGSCGSIGCAWRK